MKENREILRQIQVVMLGTGLGTAAEILVTALFGCLTWPAVLGAVVGAGLAIGNFWFTARAVIRAMDMPENAKGILRQSYGKRMAVYAIVLAVGFASGWFWWLTAVIPCLFPKLSLSLDMILHGKACIKGDAS